MAALLFATIYISEYSTALIISVFSLSILFLPQRVTATNAIVIGIGLVLLIVVVSSALPVFFSFVSDYTDSYTVSIRMEEISEMLSGQQTSGDGQKRITLWLKSLTNFVNHPILGTGTKGGGHSLILDNLSKYGLFGLIALYLQFHSLYKLSVKLYRQSEYHTLTLLMFIMNFILCIVNTLSVYGVFLLFFPLFMKYRYLKNTLLSIS